jgi:hypothetical protein
MRMLGRRRKVTGFPGKTGCGVEHCTPTEEYIDINIKSECFYHRTQDFRLTSHCIHQQPDLPRLL